MLLNSYLFFFSFLSGKLIFLSLLHFCKSYYTGTLQFFSFFSFYSLYYILSSSFLFSPSLLVSSYLFMLFYYFFPPFIFLLIFFHLFSSLLILFFFSLFIHFTIIFFFDWRVISSYLIILSFHGMITRIFVILSHRRHSWRIFHGSTSGISNLRA